MTWLSYLFVVAAGSFSAVQAGANAQLRKSLDHPLMAALCIYGSALIALLIAIPVTGVTGFAPTKVAQVPWWAWLGGLLSIMSTMAGLMLARKMGSTYFTATTVTCSLDSPQRPLSAPHAGPRRRPTVVFEFLCHLLSDHRGFDNEPRHHVLCNIQ